jgi:hypothetical protein
MVSVLKKTEEELGINITFSVETEPLGTGKLLSSEDLNQLTDSWSSCVGKGDFGQG